MSKLCGVYKITNVKNGKFYVGSSVDIRKRWAAHKSELRSGRSNCLHLQHAWDKYGEASFTFEVIEHTNDPLAREQWYIDNAKPAYNIAATAGAPMLGKKHTEEARAKMRAVNRSATPEMRAINSAANKGELNGNYGKRHPGMCSGEKSGTAKLTWKMVSGIRNARENIGLSQQVLADLFEVSRANVSMILSNKRWKNDPMGQEV